MNSYYCVNVAPRLNIKKIYLEHFKLKILKLFFVLNVEIKDVIIAIFNTSYIWI